jgi:hypothetical protein
MLLCYDRAGFHSFIGSCKTSFEKTQFKTHTHMHNPFKDNHSLKETITMQPVINKTYLLSEDDDKTFENANEINEEIQ